MPLSPSDKKIIGLAGAKSRRARLGPEEAFYASVLLPLTDKAKTPPSLLHEQAWIHTLEGPSVSVREKYRLLVTPITFGGSYWNYLLVEILDSAEEKRLGHYVRNYSSLYDTFYPFKTTSGKEYALYSKDYTATRVMSLPDCKDVGGEDFHAMGFCPTGYYVPQPEDAVAREWNDESNEHLDGTFAFLCGCVWGDDSSWKIEYLDLSDPTRPERDSRFGYIELPDNMTLVDAVNLSYYREDGMGDGYRPVKITVEKRFNISTAEHDSDNNEADLAEHRRALRRERKRQTAERAEAAAKAILKSRLSEKLQVLKNLFAWLS